VLSLPIPLRLLLARYPSELSKVMQIIHRGISTHIVNKAEFTNKQAKTGAVTLIQRFGSALNLNIHFHMLFLEGAISENPWGGTTFTRIKAPSHGDMVELVHTISQRIARYLEKVGLVERDTENSFLNLPLDDEVNPDGQLVTSARCLGKLSHRHGASARPESIYTANLTG
jgi:hypothetical protein